jgi:hypothetical protein
MQTLKLPFEASAAAAHRDLKKLAPVWQSGFAELVKTANAPGPFADRFAQLVATHMKTLEAGRAAPVGPLMQEDVYMACVYDLLNAWLTEETKHVVATAPSPAVKKQQLEALLAPIDALPWSSPNWNNIEKPRLKKRVTDAL